MIITNLETKKERFGAIISLEIKRRSKDLLGAGAFTEVSKRCHGDDRASNLNQNQVRRRTLKRVKQEEKNKIPIIKAIEINR